MAFLAADQLQITPEKHMEMGGASSDYRQLRSLKEIRPGPHGLL